MNLKSFIRPGKGAADITPLLSDGEAFVELTKQLGVISEKFEFDKVACIEGRGFLLGSALAFHMNKGIIPIRRKGKLKNETYQVLYRDYSGKNKTLEIHQDAVAQGEKVLLVDDWVETGATVKASIQLVERCGGTIAGIVAFIDDSTLQVKEELAEYNYTFLKQVESTDTF